MTDPSQPEKYHQLSKGGGEVVIEKNGKLIVFFMYRGVLDNFSGFVFSPSDKKPTQHDFNGDFKQILKARRKLVLYDIVLN